jgi:hypothetical protein
MTHHTIRTTRRRFADLAAYRLLPAGIARKVRRWTRITPPPGPACPPAGPPSVPVSATPDLPPSTVFERDRAPLTREHSRVAYLAADAILAFAATHDPEFVGKSAEDVNPDDLRRLETEALNYFTIVEQGSRAIDRAYWDRIVEEGPRLGIQAALSRCGYPAFLYIREPERSEYIEAARQMSVVPPYKDQYGDIRLFGEEGPPPDRAKISK